MKFLIPILSLLLPSPDLIENEDREIDIALLCNEKTKENEKLWIDMDWGLKPWPGKICVTKEGRIQNLTVTEVQIGLIESMDSHVLIVHTDPKRSNEIFDFSQNNSSRQMAILKKGKYVTHGGLHGLLVNSQITIYGQTKENTEKMGNVILDGNINADWNKIYNP
jgi:hypothetical protein